MNDIVQFVESHGCLVLFAVVFVRQVGVPIPGFAFILAAGALSAAGKFPLLAAIAPAAAGCMLADWLWYEAGRHSGDKVLRFIHRFMRDPEFHDRRAKRIFRRYGLPLLLVAKFVPGLDAVAPPLAGTSCANRFLFLAFESVAACLYASFYSGLGYVFSSDLNRAVAYVSHAGKLSLIVAGSGICIYLVHRLLQRRRSVRASRIVPVVSTDPVE